MASSTIVTTNARTTSDSLKFKVLHGDCFNRVPNTCYVRAPTPEGLKQKILSTLEILKFDGKNYIAQFWAPIKTGTNSILLTTTYQPSVIYGNNEELASYHEASLQQKYYINRENLVAFGLPGRVFLTCTPEQTQDAHGYPKDHRPHGPYDFYSQKWGSFGVPVIVNDQCVGVIEVVTDTPKNSYDGDISVVRTALEENTNLKTSIMIKHPFQNFDLQTLIQKMTNTNCQKRKRKTKSSDCLKYSCLAPQFGHCKRVATVNLGIFVLGTFRNVHKTVGIDEWPWIKNKTSKASSVHGTQMNETASSETSSFGTSDAPILNSCDVNPELTEETVIVVRASAPETQNYHVALDEDWIEKVHERPDFMQEFDDYLIDQGDEAPGMEDIDMVDAYFDYGKWDQEQLFGPIPC